MDGTQEVWKLTWWRKSGESCQMACQRKVTEMHLLDPDKNSRGAVHINKQKKEGVSPSVRACDLQTGKYLGWLILFTPYKGLSGCFVLSHVGTFKLQSFIGETRCQGGARCKVAPRSCEIKFEEKRQRVTSDHSASGSRWSCFVGRCFYLIKKNNKINR